MVNIKEISIGSFVEVLLSSANVLFCQVVEILRDNRVGVLILHKTLSKVDMEYGIGTIAVFNHFRLYGVTVSARDLRQIGFTDSDERGWELVYWFGDMKLLYRLNRQRDVGSFRFKTPYRKSYTAISCRKIHELQNIMWFLTGGELEFEYVRNEKKSKYQSKT